MNYFLCTFCRESTKASLRVRKTYFALFTQRGIAPLLLNSAFSGKAGFPYFAHFAKLTVFFLNRKFFLSLLTLLQMLTLLFNSAMFNVGVFG